MNELPDLSRFELQCLRKLWNRGEATVRDIHDDLDNPPSYSTVRKIVERLEEKGAIVRVRKDDKALVYRSAVSPSAMLKKEVRRFLDAAFDGSAAPLVAQLADMNEVSIEDIRALEEYVSEFDDAGGAPQPERGPDHVTDGTPGHEDHEDASG
jgi:BlaI family penicillinase repressor